MKTIICGKSTKSIPTRLIVAIVVLILLVVVIILPLAAGDDFVAVMYGSSLDTKIEDADDFVDVIRDNTRRATKANYEVSPKSNGKIVLKKEHIDRLADIVNYSGERGARLYGTIDGMGKTLVVDCEMTAPLFEQICSGGALTNLNIELGRNAKVAKGNKEFAVIAKINNGSIADIMLNATIDIGDGASAVGGLVVYNNGKIRNCYIENSYITDRNYWTNGDKLDRNVWNCCVGSIAAYNMKDGEVKLVYIDSRFSGRDVAEGLQFAVLNLLQYNNLGNKNTTIGYAFGHSPAEGLDNIENVFVISSPEANLNVVDLSQPKIVYKDVKSSYTNDDWVNWTYNKDDDVPPRLKGQQEKTL